MSEHRFREDAWHSVSTRIIAMIEDYSGPWLPGGPSKAVADAIVNKIRAMPVPHPQQEPPA